MKEASQWDVTRKLKLVSLDSTVTLKEIETKMLKNQAIKVFQFSRKDAFLLITYDASKIGLPEIYNTLKTYEVKRQKSIWQNFKYYCYQYTDGNRRDNANSGPAACCNKAPSIKK